MRRTALIGGAIVALFLLSAPGALLSRAWAGPWEDGMAAYNRGDYLPAIRLFRPLAEAGNPKAQSVIGAMYRKGQGVAKSSPRLHLVQPRRQAGRRQGQGGIAGSVAGYDASRDFAGARGDAGLRGL